MHLALNPPIKKIIDSPQWRSGEPGDLRSNRVHGEVIRRMETCGQIACSVGRLPIRFTVGTGGTIRADTGVCPYGQVVCTVRLSDKLRPSVRSRARSGDYPSVSRWAQAARSGQTQGSTAVVVVRCVPRENKNSSRRGVVWALEGSNLRTSRM